ncbi:murein L,D-transpeptidase [Sphingobium phenoxybenzoativorans]|uniref:Murein L,D-transpeptidase n=1 Tax=Sphingobium phenoxybenzoativorans TaxID=1592790 RepID=A0A975K5G9_9SPHN|nr:L,D-transpeptidase [Sphingobium phenoxybenzoativorans]QUT05160.1 murein L,D-transpeptidase [Sphingobium phenoxybenzoativorans]
MSLKFYPFLAGVVLLAGCHIVSDEAATNQAKGKEAKAAPANNYQSLSFADAQPAATPADMPLLKVQLVLDQLRFSPGVIDGQDGQSLKLALRGFQQALGLPETGALDDATKKALERWRDIPALRRTAIPAAFAKGPFIPNFPGDAEQQAKLAFLGYRDLTEALAERFHTTPELLAKLNPNVTFAAGTVITVPNVRDVDPKTLGKDERGWNRTLQLLAVAPDQPQAAKVIVDKSDGVLRAFDETGKLIAQFPATMGSSHDPLPIGTWKIQGVSRNPDFHYNPKLFWDVSNAKDDVMLKPGPNGPVGVAWIDLSKPHYGIHGTSEPQTIGRAESHGCVRLTNWDAARLAQMVKVGTPAVFQK